MNTWGKGTDSKSLIIDEIEQAMMRGWAFKLSPEDCARYRKHIRDDIEHDFDELSGTEFSDKYGHLVIQ